MAAHEGVHALEKLAIRNAAARLRERLAEEIGEYTARNSTERVFLRLFIRPAGREQDVAALWQFDPPRFFLRLRRARRGDDQSIEKCLHWSLAAIERHPANPRVIRSSCTTPRVAAIENNHDRRSASRYFGDKLRQFLVRQIPRT